MMRKACIQLSLIFLCVLGATFSVYAQDRLAQFSTTQWLEDLQFLSQKINGQFASFTPQSRKDFNEAVGHLEKNIPKLSGTEIVIEMNKMVAMLKDGHTELNLLQSEIGFMRLPLVLYYFGKDLHIIYSSPEYKSLLGKKIRLIEGQAVEEVHRQILPFLAHDNEIEFLLEAPNYMMTTDLLEYMEVSKTREHINLTVEEASGKVETVQVKAIQRADYSKMDWISARGESKAPLYLENNSSYYWYTFFEKEKALYFKCNRINNQKGEKSLKKIVDELFKELDSQKADKLIIDLRLNRGGNYHKGESLIKEILKRPPINQKGKVFVLTDRYTFSAACAITGFLKRETNALTVGEPARSRPNGADNYEPYSLPNSKIGFGVTNRLKDLFPELGDAPFIPIDIPVTTSFEEYQRGEDPVLLKVLSY